MKLSLAVLAAVLLLGCDSPTSPAPEMFDLATNAVVADAFIEIAAPEAWHSLSIEPCDEPDAAVPLGALAAGATARIRVDAGCHALRWRPASGGSAMSEVDVGPGETVRVRWAPVVLVVGRQS
jgi:hypothetical protein